MATVAKQFDVAVPAQFAWEAVKAFGDVHLRLAAEFVVSSGMENGLRHITFANGMVATERLIAIDEKRHRLVYAAISDKVQHHNASFQLSPINDKSTRVLWTTDILPDELKDTIEPMMEEGVQAIQTTLTDTYQKEFI